MSIWYLLLFAAGLLMLVRPQLFWKLEQLMTMRRGEANPSYLNITRICGGCFAVAAVVLIVISLI